MAESKEYIIDNFDKLANIVNEKNAEKLAVDLANMLVMYQKYITLVRNERPKETKGKKNTQIAKLAFTWFDDGKNDVLGLDFVDKKTGEITKIRYEK